MTRRALLSTLAALLASAFAAPPALRLKITPRIAYAPSDLHVEIRLIPVASDRELLVEAEGEAFYRSSSWPLEGEQSPTLYRIDRGWSDFPPGHYEIRAAVWGNGRLRASARDSALFL